MEKPIRKLVAFSWRSTAHFGAKAIPKGLRKHLEDRFFYAVFNLTRVTNDHYPQASKEE